MPNILQEALLSGLLYGLWSLAFAICSAPCAAFNLNCVTFGFASGFIAIAIARYNAGIHLTVLFAIFSGVVLSYLAHRFIFRPLVSKNQSNRSILLASLGLIGVIQAVITLCFGSELVSIRSIPTIRESVAFIAEYPSNSIVLSIAALLIFILLWSFLYRTRYGLIYRACCDSNVAATFFRLRIDRVQLWASVFGGGIAAVAMLLHLTVRAAAPFHLLPIAVVAITGAIIGGQQNPLFAFLGGIVLGTIEVVAMQYLDASLRDLLVGVTLVVLLVCKPMGIFSRLLRRS